MLILDEIIEAGERAQAIAREQPVDRLRADLNARDALLWNMTIIGEAANQLSEAFRARFPGVAWRKPISLRNRIVHGYWGIDLDIVHTAAAAELPDFLDGVRAVRDVVDSPLPQPFGGVRACVHAGP
ncbi:MAG: HepT-like ribonuclease domain-containing protein [Candidatus Nanopelagicales bacterium]